MIRKLKKKKGFTLVEIIAAVAIFSIIVVFLTSLMGTIFKFSSVNKKTFDSNSISRGFYELIRNNRPSSTNVYPSNLAGDGTNGVYYVIYVKDQTDLSLAVTSFVTNVTDTRFIKYDKTAKTFDQIKSSNPSSDYKYAIQVLVKKETVGTNYYYELESQTWNLNKGETTEIKRKSLIAEG